MVNYHNKIFKPVRNSVNGETSPATTFHYMQEGNIITAEYAGGNIIKGHLLGLADEKGIIRMHYHQINNQGILMTGQCTSTPEIQPNGKIRLYESWQWTSGDRSAGNSVIEEQ